MFIAYNASGRTIYEEQLHAIYARLTGHFKPRVSATLFGELNPNYDHDDRWWEQVVIPYLNKRYPK